MNKVDLLMKEIKKLEKSLMYARRKRNVSPEEIKNLSEKLRIKKELLQEEEEKLD